MSEDTVWGEWALVKALWQRWEPTFTDTQKKQGRRAMMLGDVHTLRRLVGFSETLAHARGWPLRVRVIFTGFEPFGPHAHNPSQLVANQAAQVLRQQRFDSKYMCLPVTFSCAESWPVDQCALAEVDEDIDACVFVHVGLAAKRQAVCFERTAFNSHDGVLGNDDKKGPQDGQLVSGGRPVRQTAFDVESLVDWWPLNTPPAQLSDDAGRYVCNAIYYASLTQVERLRADGHTTDALFVHVPALDEDGAIQVGQALGQVMLKLLASLGQSTYV